MSDRHGTARRDYRRVLLIKPSSLGDIVHALPVLAALRDAQPGAYVAWLVETGSVPLLEKHPLIDEVIPFDRRRYGKMLRSAGALADFVRFLGRLRRRRFDLVIDLQGLYRSGFMAFVTGARQRVGFADARELAGLFYTRRVRCPDDRLHAVERNLCVAEGLAVPARAARFPLGLAGNELDAARAVLRAAGGRPLERFTAAVVGGRWQSKLWPAENWAALLDRLAEEGHPPGVLLGGPGDAEFAARIARQCRRPPLNLAGRTSLRELVALLALAEVVICHDSGPMHIAAALGRPTLALFGPTDPARTGPYSPAARVVRLPLDCSPCRERTCPLGHHACLRQLGVRRVVDELRQLPAAVRGAGESLQAGAGTASGREFVHNS